MHALWALIGTGRLEPEFHARLLDHSDPAYRAWGSARRRRLRQGGTRDPRSRGGAWHATRAPMFSSRSPSPHGRSRGWTPCRSWSKSSPPAARTSSSPRSPGRTSTRSCPTRAIASSSSIDRVDLKPAPALAKLLPRVVDRILGDPDANMAPVRSIIERLVAQDSGLARQCLSAVSERAREMSEPRRKELQSQLEPVLRRILADGPAPPLTFDAQLLAFRLGLLGRSATAAPSATGSSRLDQPEAIRLQALEALIAFRDPALPDAFAKVLSSGSPAFLARVLAASGRSDDPKLADVVLSQYPRLDPELQPLAIDFLLQREPWARKLLNTVLAKKLPRTTLNANHLRKILESNDREAIWAVEKEWGNVREERNPQREKVVAEMGDYLRQHPGDAKAGQAVFKKLCVQCHTIYGEGEALGPDLTSNGRGSFDQLVASVFDPSLVIGPSYQTTTVVTEDGRNLTGLVTEDSDRRIVLAMPGGGKEIVARNEVKYTRTSKLSMMPEGIETILDRKELADLFAFLSLDHPPGDPRARRIPGVRL